MFKLFLLLNPVYVTLFWAIILNLYDRKIYPAKVFLGRFMLAAFIVYVSHLFYFLRQLHIYVLLDSFYTWASLSVYPMFHIYVRLLIIDKFFSFKKHSIYLIAPTIIFLLLAIGYLLMDKEERMNYVSSILTGAEKGKGITAYMHAVYLAGRLIFIIQTVLYLVLNCLLILNNNRTLQNFYSNIESRKLGWVQFFNISMAFTSISSISLAIIGREKFLNHDYYLILPSLVFSLMLFIIGYLGNKQRQIFSEKRALKMVSTYNADDAIPERLKEDLIALFKNKKVYLQKDLKIWDVSGLLATNRTYISRIINQDFDKNFCSFVNDYRIEHAKKLLAENKNYSNEEIAELSGFGSINSFYRVFKQKDNISIGKYREDNFK